VTKLPVVSGKELIKYLSKKGFRAVRTSGSHVIMKKDGIRPFPVPLHNELDRGTLGAILDQAEIRDEFIDDWYGN
jgi:predicted RNA binding protein YcfA (HicA-like mRNA interferase family)